MSNYCVLVVLSAAAALTPTARAQFAIDWYTIDGGGGASAGGAFSLTGTIGQPDTGASAGATVECGGGFWGALPGAAPCYANCDGSTAAPILNVADFACFLQKYASLDAYANCDGSTAAPILNVSDFTCFLQKYANGCP